MFQFESIQVNISELCSTFFHLQLVSQIQQDSEDYTFPSSLKPIKFINFYKNFLQEQNTLKWNNIILSLFALWPIALPCISNVSQGSLVENYWDIQFGEGQASLWRAALVELLIWLVERWHANRNEHGSKQGTNSASSCHLVFTSRSASCCLSLSLSLSLISLRLSAIFVLSIQKGSTRVVQKRGSIGTNETIESYFTRLFLPTLAALGDSGEGVLTWDAMTLSTFQKYDCTLARHTARGEFSGCLHRWRSCCECHSGPLVASYDAPFSKSCSEPINLSPVFQILNDRILRSSLTSLPFLSHFFFFFLFFFLEFGF